jgi:hypothetical protein
MDNAPDVLPQPRSEAVLGYAATARAALVSMIAAACLTACSEYVDRKNTIAFSAGNAVQTNIITHVVDPWPASARNKYFAVNGQRMQRAVENYRCGRIATSGDSSSNGSNTGSESAAPPTQGSEGTC